MYNVYIRIYITDATEEEVTKGPHFIEISVNSTQIRGGYDNNHSTDHENSRCL